MRHATALLALLLGGCAAGSVSDYAPYVRDIHNPLVLKQDEADCFSNAAHYHRPLNGEAILSEGAQGAAGNAAGGAVSLAVPLAGGLGAAGSELLRQLGLLQPDQRRVFLICLHDRGEHSGAYHVMDPDL